MPTVVVCVFSQYLTRIFFVLMYESMIIALEKFPLLISRSVALILIPFRVGQINYTGVSNGCLICGEYLLTKSLDIESRYDFYRIHIF